MADQLAVGRLPGALDGFKRGAVNDNVAKLAVTRLGQGVVRFLCGCAHRLGQRAELLGAHSIQNRAAVDGSMRDKDAEIAFTRADKLDCGLQVVIIVGVEEHVKHGHILDQLADQIPGFFSLGGQQARVVRGDFSVAPSAVGQQTQAFVIALGREQLIDRLGIEKRQLL